MCYRTLRPQHKDMNMRITRVLEHLDAVRYVMSYFLFCPHDFVYLPLRPVPRNY